MQNSNNSSAACFCCVRGVACMQLSSGCLCLSFLLVGKHVMGAPRAQSFAVTQGTAIIVLCTLGTCVLIIQAGNFQVAAKLV